MFNFFFLFLSLADEIKMLITVFEKLKSQLHLDDIITESRSGPGCRYHSDSQFLLFRGSTGRTVSDRCGCRRRRRRNVINYGASGKSTECG